MKAYNVDLRKRIVAFVKKGGAKAEAAKRFSVGRRTVYRYLEADMKDGLEPKKSWGGWRKLDPRKLRDAVAKNPDATLRELQEMFGVSHHAIWSRLRQMNFTLKKSHSISRAERAAKVAVPARAGVAVRPSRSLPRRVRDRPPTAQGIRPRAKRRKDI